jgi:hypothetical protein
MKPKPRTINDEMQHVLEELEGMESSSEEYTTAVKNLKELSEAGSKKPARIIEPEVIFAGVVGILEILMILQYERLDVITSKALSWVRRM